MPSHTSIRVRYKDTDTMSVVYYGNYLTYFEVARVEYLRERGLPMSEVNRRVHMPVVEACVHYDRPALLDDLSQSSGEIGKSGRVGRLLDHVGVQPLLTLREPVELLLHPRHDLARLAHLRRIRCIHNGFRSPDRRCSIRTPRRCAVRPARSRSRSLAKAEVLLDPARQVAQLPVTEQGELVVTHPLEQVAVVRDDDERAGPAIEHVLERGQRLDVEVVGRLVEDEDVGLREE